MAAGFEQREVSGQGYRSGLVVRLMPNGDFDPRFGRVVPDVVDIGHPGKLLINLRNRSGDLADVALLPLLPLPGRYAYIAVGKERRTDGSIHHDPVLVALDDTGALVQGFGDDGRWMALNMPLQAPRRLVIHPVRTHNGFMFKAVVAGYEASGQTKMAAGRFVLSAVRAPIGPIAPRPS